jgi:hypothetical protein
MILRQVRETMTVIAASFASRKRPTALAVWPFSCCASRNIHGYCNSFVGPSMLLQNVTRLHQRASLDATPQYQKQKSQFVERHDVSHFATPSARANRASNPRRLLNTPTGSVPSHHAPQIARKTAFALVSSSGHRYSKHVYKTSRHCRLSRSEIGAANIPPRVHPLGTPREKA